MKKNDEIKCDRCVELCGCWRGQHGGKPNCLCFSPKMIKKPIDKLNKNAIINYKIKERK